MIGPNRRIGTRSAWLLGAALFAAQAQAHASAQTRPAPAPVVADAPAPLRAADTFAMVWEKLRESGFDRDRGDIDWAALEATHRSAIENAADLQTLRMELNRLLQAVGVSHLSLIPAEAVPEPKTAASASRRTSTGSETRQDAGSASTTTKRESAGNTTARESDAVARATKDDESESDDAPSDLGLRAVMIDGALHVFSVRPDSAAADAGIRPGWQIEAIDAWTLDKALNSLAAQPEGPGRRRAELRFELHANDRVSGLSPGEEVALRLRDTAGRPRTARLTARPTPGTRLQLMPGMPETTLRYTAERIDLATGGCALRVGFDVWVQEAFDRLAASLREQRDCDRLLLDLRGNPGGQMWTVTSIGGLLFEAPTSLGTLSSADGNLRLTVLPRRVAEDGTLLRRLRGPVAVLIDRGSGSCSEIFAAGLQATGRARVFGETSAGMALPAVTARLPSGDWLYFPTADLTDPKGRRIEGHGVTPDVVAAPSVAALAAGQDPALAAALAWVAETSQDGRSSAPGQP